MSDQACLIYDIKKYAIHDGPGIRTTVFFKGCPLSCHWCHNPESISAKPRLVYHFARCIGCRECIAGCPGGALAPSPAGAEAGIEINRSLCRTHGTCVQVCPAQALEMQGIYMEVFELAKTIKKDLIFFDSSRGGVTFSGGEPLAQWEALKALLGICRSWELHTTVDTSGFSTWQALKAVAENTDLFLYDLKVMDPDLHKQYTGVSNTRILDNLGKLSGLGKDIIIRIPLIPGVNDDDGALHAFGRFISSMAAVNRVDILAYHDFHVSKYDKLDLPYRMHGTRVPSKQRLFSAVNILSGYGLKVSPH